MVPTQKFSTRVVQHSPVAVPRWRRQLHDRWPRWNIRSLSPEHDQCRPECSRNHHRAKFRHRTLINDEFKLKNFSLKMIISRWQQPSLERWRRHRRWRPSNGHHQHWHTVDGRIQVQGCHELHFILDGQPCRVLSVILHRKRRPKVTILLTQRDTELYVTWSYEFRIKHFIRRG